MNSMIGTGLKGLIGSKVTDQLKESYRFSSLDVSDPVHPVDITKYEQVEAALAADNAPTVLHLAAFTDVTAAWQQTDDKNGLAYQVNVVGTENVVKACAATNKHLIHVSTAFVFDGTKSTMYTEEDTPAPIEWYGKTKAWAEEVVMKAESPWTILRIDFPFRLDAFPRPDIVTKTLSGIAKGYPLFNDHFFGPTLIEDVVKVIEWAARTKTTGLYHASSGEQWSDYQLGLALQKKFGFSTPVKEGSLTEYLKTSQRPYQRNTALDCSKLKNAIDFELLTVEQALQRVERDLSELSLT